MYFKYQSGRSYRGFFKWLCHMYHMCHLYHGVPPARYTYEYSTYISSISKGAAIADFSNDCILCIMCAMCIMASRQPTTRMSILHLFSVSIRAKLSQISKWLYQMYPMYHVHHGVPPAHDTHEHSMYIFKVSIRAKLSPNFQMTVSYVSYVSCVSWSPPSPRRVWVFNIYFKYQ